MIADGLFWIRHKTQGLHREKILYGNLYIAMFIKDLRLLVLLDDNNWLEYPEDGNYEIIKNKIVANCKRDLTAYYIDGENYDFCFDNENQLFVCCFEDNREIAYDQITPSVFSEHFIILSIE